MTSLKEIAALSFTLLVHSGVLTEEEINLAKQDGYEGLDKLLGEKILIATGAIKNDSKN